MCTKTIIAADRYVPVQDSKIRRKRRRRSNSAADKRKPQKQEKQTLPPLCLKGKKKLIIHCITNRLPMMSIIIVQFIKIIATRGVELNKKRDEAIGVNE